MLLTDASKIENGDNNLLCSSEKNSSRKMATKMVMSVDEIEAAEEIVVGQETNS